jgi:hypothetical protein
MLSEHLRLLTIGISAGLLISVALTRFLQAWLFGISATDPFLFCSALLILSALSVLRLSYRRDVLPFSTRRKPWERIILFTPQHPWITAEKI